MFITHSHVIKSETYLETSLGFRYSNTNENNKFIFLNIDDAWWYYNNISARIGIRKHITNSFFIGASCNYNYKYLNDFRFNNYVDFEGNSYDEDYIVNRTKNQFGLLSKAGFNLYESKFLFIESYLGGGLVYSMGSQTTNEIYDWKGNSVPNDNSFIRFNTFNFTIHFGVSVGIKSYSKPNNLTY